MSLRDIDAPFWKEVIENNCYFTIPRSSGGSIAQCQQAGASSPNGIKHHDVMFYPVWGK